ncbi:MAG: ParB N-terminal domain-containing protein [Promethearchaeota archaeon]
MRLLQIREEVETAIRLEKLESLRPHEKTDPKVVEQLAHKIEIDGIQKDPIIVDRDSNVVLDGMHRLAALKKLSCTNTLCYFVPYKHVEVDRWYRLFVSNQTVPAISMIESMQRLDKFDIEYTDDPQEATKFINESKAAGALITKEKSILIKNKEAVKDLVDIYNHLRFIELLFIFHFGIRIKFASKIEIEGKDVIGVLVPPKLSCKDVIIAAKSKILFPLKSTRHIPKIRPLSVNLPISFLRDKEIQEKNKELKTFLHQKKIQLFPRGMEINGRAYEEAILQYK